ncbi:MAG TPA: rhamnose ABC transporter substrate-binding protein [Spirochaetia bacterium]|nr:rhamnose ABC transporter substrate-binding protein [Spirochaetia bacterium]HRZ64017.1 rhamnose ABC transporter substrate-binding protein [Spirochaetia bacterium]
MKKTLRMLSLALALALVAGAALSLGSCAKAAPKTAKIAMVVKSMGNPFFDACRDGAQEAAKELGGIEIIYQGPSTPTAEGQIEIIDSLIAQKVDGIIVSANDKDALIPITKKAMSKGIKVMSFDSAIAAGGRMVDLVPSETELIGKQQVQLISELIGAEGEVAILSATSQATNQNAWIEVMKKEFETNPAYAKMKLVATVYGDDLSDKSYREAMGLFESYPKLKGIISPTTVGVAAAGKAITDKKLIGKVQLVGLGLPSEMKFYVMNDACKQFALWNPVDLGYSATQITNALVKGKLKSAKDGTPVKAGEVVEAGRMGKITIGESGVAVMGNPFVFNKSNVEKYASIF